MSSKRFFVFHVSGHGVEPVGIDRRRGGQGVEFRECCVRQFHMDGFQIVFELVWLCSSDDDARDHLLRQQPCQCYLGDAGVALPADLAYFFDELESEFLVERQQIESGEPVFLGLQIIARVLAAQEAAGERAPHGHAEAGVLHEWNNLVLHVASQQRVVHLPAREFCPASFVLNPEPRGGPPGGPVRVADVSDLAGSNHIIQGFQCFMERRVAVFPMHDVEVDVIRLKALQACVAGSEDMPPRKSGLRHRLSASEADLRGDHNILPPIAQQLTEHDFGLSLRVPSAVSKKLIPASSDWLTRARAPFVSTLVTEGNRVSVPNVIAPKASLETIRPVFPRREYCMRPPFWIFHDIDYGLYEEGGYSTADRMCAVCLQGELVHQGPALEVEFRHDSGETRSRRIWRAGFGPQRGGPIRELFCSDLAGAGFWCIDWRRSAYLRFSGLVCRFRDQETGYRATDCGVGRSAPDAVFVLCCAGFHEFGRDVGKIGSRTGTVAGITSVESGSAGVDIHAV